MSDLKEFQIYDDQLISKDIYDEIKILDKRIEELMIKMRERYNIANIVLTSIANAINGDIHSKYNTLLQYIIPNVKIFNYIIKTRIEEPLEIKINGKLQLYYKNTLIEFINKVIILKGLK